MSTKNISRSALEGGRRNYNKFDRRYSARRERTFFRNWRQAVLQDAEVAEELFAPLRMPVFRGFTDKLSPALRWLDSRVGDSWDDVFSDLCKKFDDRRLSSWHIVHQHMLPEVKGAGSQEERWDTFFHVDDDGNLAGEYGTGRVRHATKPDNGISYEEFNEWLDNRFVMIDTQKRVYWANPVVKSWVACPHLRRVQFCRIPVSLHRKVETTPSHIIRMYTEDSSHRPFGKGDWWRKWEHQHFAASRWSRGQRLSPGDEKFWNAASSWYKYRNIKESFA